MTEPELKRLTVKEDTSPLILSLRRVESGPTTLIVYYIFVPFDNLRLSFLDYHTVVPIKGDDRLFGDRLLS